jgi:transposase
LTTGFLAGIMFFMMPPVIAESLFKKFSLLKGELDERSRRIWAATEALAIGHGGIKAVANATGISESTIRIGKKELDQGISNKSIEGPLRRIRRKGGGRKALTEFDGSLVSALDALVEPNARGDPMSPLRWTCKSTRNLAKELKKKGHPVSHTKVAQLLQTLGYSLQSTRKTKEGSSHPDRNAQFEFIYEKVKGFQKIGHPVISVDAKKKELVGDFANKGKEYQPKGHPEPVRVYDFLDKNLGKITPYGVYDEFTNSGWVSVGVDHDTAQFAVESIRRWWLRMGCKTYSNATELLITADGGGSNGSRCRLWKVAIQELVNETGLSISVSHFPPGTSKWNKIEHRMFSHITENWRGRPLISREVVVNLIANASTSAGLSIQAALDLNEYPTGIKISDEQMRSLNIHPGEFHGTDWNYTIKPST